MATMANQGNDDFEFHTNTKRGGNNFKRVYIGNLPKNRGSSLQGELEAWLKEQIDNLEAVSVQVKEGKSNPHALVDCGRHANTMISKLHQVTWEGQKLVVQRERRPKPASKKKPAMQSSWKRHEEPPVPASMEEVSQKIHDVVSDEFKQSQDDPINIALASTAAVAMLASAMNGFADTPDNEGTTDEGEFQLKPMADLMAEFGEADPNWKNVVVDEVPETADPPTSRLAPHGKAPIHVWFSSFGFQKGAPKRMDGWSHQQPYRPFDCTDFEKVPGYLEWRDGLAGAVKRACFYLKRQPENGDDEADDGNLKDYAIDVVADKTWDALVQAQESGEYGYARPLEMTIHVGSESGRHRSVVVCEWAATALRRRLRKNEGDTIQQPVSVGTTHHEVEASRQQRKQNKQAQGGKKKGMEFAGDW